MFGCQLVSINKKPTLFQVTESFADKIKDSGITCSFRGKIQVRGLSRANAGQGGFMGKHRLVRLYRGKHRLWRFQGQTQVSEVIRGKHKVSEVSGANTGYGGYRGKHRLWRL